MVWCLSWDTARWWLCHLDIIHHISYIIYYINIIIIITSNWGDNYSSTLLKILTSEWFQLHAKKLLSLLKSAALKSATNTSSGLQTIVSMFVFSGYSWSLSPYIHHYYDRLLLLSWLSSLFIIVIILFQGDRLQCSRRIRDIWDLNRHWGIFSLLPSYHHYCHYWDAYHDFNSYDDGDYDFSWWGWWFSLWFLSWWRLLRWRR